MLTFELFRRQKMSDMTDGLWAILARPWNHQDVYVKRRAPIEHNTHYLHILSCRKLLEGVHFPNSALLFWSMTSLDQMEQPRC